MARAAIGDGTVESNVKIAHETNGGPTLSNDDFFGTSDTNIGDLDGDGITDLAVGASHDNTGGTNRGAVYILFMDSDGTADSTVKIASGTNGGPTLVDFDYFGGSVAAIGDLDGDNIEDLAVGAYGDNTGASASGAVHILFMDTDGTVDSSIKIASGTNGGPTLSVGDNFGKSVASIDDLDGDNIDDLIVGAWADNTNGTDRGAAYVLFMDTDGTADSTVKIASGTNGGPTLTNDDRFGSSVASIGDLDGDNVTDLAVGAIREDTGGDNRGAAFILFMNSNGTVDSSVKIAHENNGGPTLINDDYFGNSIASLGDLNGDNILDLAVGAYRDNTNDRGVAYVLFMNSNGTVDSSVKIGSGLNGGPTLDDDDYFGVSITSIGDLDGDGVIDLAVGAEGDDTGSTQRGAVYILFMTDLPDSTAYTTNKTATLSRLKAGETSVDFALSFELSGTDTGQLELVFPADFTVTSAFDAGTCSSGGTINTFGSTASTLTATMTDCFGTVTLTGATITNPSTPGTYILSWSSGVHQVAVPIVDDDQVTVTSDVDPVLSFDIDTSISTAADTAAPYTVDFGSLNLTNTNVSGEGTVNYIMVDLSTNATHGAVVTVLNANGSSGLVSTSSPSDSISNAAAAMSSGTENYGFCVQYVNETLGETFNKAGDYATGTCADQADGNDVEALSSSTAADIFTVDGPVSAARGVISGSAAADALTEAHDDYTDTLTFIATSTF